MDLDAAADELFAISPDDFMARRTALVAEAKQAGDKALAKQMGALRKPTRSAWLVNLVARAEPEQVAALIELAGELQSAQQAMDGDALRTLSRQRRTRIDVLARRAAELGRAAGFAAADGALPEVGATLQAALGDPAVAERVCTGRLAQAVAYGGFGGLASGGDDLTSALAASMAAKPERKLKAVPPLPPDAEDAAEPEPEPDPEAVERARQLRAEADEAQAALAAAETAADDATTRADELADEVESLRTRLRDTEAAEREAREDARAARKALTEARRAAAAAGQAASRAGEDG